MRVVIGQSTCIGDEFNALMGVAEQSPPFQIMRTLAGFYIYQGILHEACEGKPRAMKIF
jgi:hypothetical protein